MLKKMILISFVFSLTAKPITFINNSRHVIFISDHHTQSCLLESHEECEFTLTDQSNSLFIYTLSPQNPSQTNLFDLAWQVCDANPNDEPATIYFQNLQMPKKLEFLYPQRFTVINLKKEQSMVQNQQVSGIKKNISQNKQAATSSTSHGKNDKVQTKSTQKLDDPHMAVIAALSKQLQKMHPQNIDNDIFKNMHNAKRKK